MHAIRSPLTIHSVFPNLILLHQQHVFLDPDFPTGLSGLELLRGSLSSRSPEKEGTESPVTPLTQAVKIPYFPSSYLCCWLSSRNPPCSPSPLSPIQFQMDFCLPNPIPECSDNMGSLVRPATSCITSFLRLFSQDLLDIHAGLLAPFAWLSACQEGLCLTLEEAILENLPYLFSLGPHSKQVPEEVQVCSPDVQPCVSICLVPSSHDPEFHHIAISLQPLTFTSLMSSFFV